MGQNKQNYILSLFTLSILLISSITTPLAFATHVNPSPALGTTGNITVCPSPMISILIPATSGGPLIDGTYSSGSFSVTVDFHTPLNENTNSFVDWTSTHDMNTVYVKGGNKYNTYTYALSTDFSDTNLKSPLNMGGNIPTISHVLFCFDPSAPPQQLPCETDPDLCVDTGNECTFSQCLPNDPNADSNGCVISNEPQGTTCGDADAACVNQDLCDGAGGCTDNGFKDATTACGDPTDDECNNPDHCSGTDANCIDEVEPQGTACGDQGVDCQIDDACDGQGACMDNGAAPSGTLCSAGVCTADAACVPIITKYYTYTNNDFENNLFAPNLPTNGDGDFILEGKLTTGKNPKTTVTPGQYFAVSKVEVVEGQTVWIEEDFEECIPIGDVNPRTGKGGVQVVLEDPQTGILTPIHGPLWDGIGGSIVLGATSAEVHIDDVPDNTNVYVLVKFQPKSTVVPPLIGTECENFERLFDSDMNLLNEASATLLVVQKP